MLCPLQKRGIGGPDGLEMACVHLIQPIKAFFQLQLSQFFFCELPESPKPRRGELRL